MHIKNDLVEIEKSGIFKIVTQHKFDTVFRDRGYTVKTSKPKSKAQPKGTKQVGDDK
jgi:hypothetical protein